MPDEKPLSKRLQTDHHKGDAYRIQGIATHAATDDAMIIYRVDSSTEWDGHIWVRSRHMFDEIVKHEGKVEPRFVEYPKQTRL